MAGGAVTVTVNGVGELVGLAITAGQFDGTDSDDLSDLSDMIIAAYRDAKGKADALASEAIGPLAGLGLGGGSDDRGRGAQRPSSASRASRCTKASSRT